MPTASTLHRRDLLRTLGAGASFAAIASPIATSAKADSENSNDKVKARYRESQEVKTFYRVNRYPAT
jgi:hypothetical protein